MKVWRGLAETERTVGWRIGGVREGIDGMDGMDGVGEGEGKREGKGEGKGDILGW